MSQPERPYTRLGEQIDHLIRALALAKNWRMGRTVAEVAERTSFAEATVYRWRQGRLRPPDETLEQLARIGKEEAGLDRTWGKSLFRSAHHPDAARLVNEIWGPKEIRLIPENLPPPLHTAFVGRQPEMARLLELISPDHAAHLISIDGIGGVGKTALVLETAYRCLRASTGEALNPRVPTFDAIIFASAKQQYLTPGGILARHQAQRTLRDIFREIAQILDRPDITRATPEEQPTRVRYALARQRTLLIVDNLETVEDRETILDLPVTTSRPRSKVVITTREQALFSPIRLEHLPEEEGLQLILHEAQEKNVALDETQAQALYQRTGGVPAAMVYAVGQIAAGHSVEAVLELVAQASGDVARFCFEGSIAPLRGQPAHHLLMAIAMFPKRPLQEAVIHVAGLAADPLTADDGLARLQQLSLVNQREGRYSMLPLTREYALAELAAHPAFEREAREQWIGWYLNFTQTYGGRDWQEWHIQYDRLEGEWENILVVLDWCAAQERYENVAFLWRNVDDFANIYGHWDDSIRWQEWVVQAAERRGDWPIAIRWLVRETTQLTFMGRIMKAEATVARALDHRKYASPKLEGRMLIALARICIRKGRLREAHEWLAQSHQALQHVDLEGRQLKRDAISHAYWQAVAHFEAQNYGQAEQHFRHVLEQGQAIRWQRAVIYTQNWLADIAIEQGDLDEAERLLRTGLPMAKRNKDRRRTAYYKRSFAYLEQKRGNLAEARRWATKALDGFERLGMQPETEEMRELVEALQER